MLRIFLPLLIATSALAAPMRTSVGVYVTRLGDLNPPNNSFSADLWVWTLSDPASPLRPIETLRLRHAKQVSGEKPESLVRGGRMYGYRYFTVNMQQSWDMRESVKRHIDRRAAWIVFVSFVVVNAVLFVLAI